MAAGIVVSSDSEFVFLAAIAATDEQEQIVAVLSLDEAEKIATDLLGVVKRRKMATVVRAPGNRKIQ